MMYGIVKLAAYHDELIYILCYIMIFLRSMKK